MLLVGVKVVWLQMRCGESLLVWVWALPLAKVIYEVRVVVLGVGRASSQQRGEANGSWRLMDRGCSCSDSGE